ncbi:MAG: hypothetical protein M1817_006246 [Caeruleum heppii]|nr:MAG: hypothetical protein M1817_006246 [Caeruleum heppii]
MAPGLGTFIRGRPDRSPLPSSPPPRSPTAHETQASRRQAVAKLAKVPTPITRLHTPPGTNRQPSARREELSPTIAVGETELATRSRKDDEYATQDHHRDIFGTDVGALDDLTNSEPFQVGDTTEWRVPSPFDAHSQDPSRLLDRDDYQQPDEPEVDNVPDIGFRELNRDSSPDYVRVDKVREGLEGDQRYSVSERPRAAVEPDIFHGPETATALMTKMFATREPRKYTPPLPHTGEQRNIPSHRRPETQPYPVPSSKEPFPGTDREDPKAASTRYKTFDTSDFSGSDEDENDTDKDDEGNPSSQTPRQHSKEPSSSVSPPQDGQRPTQSSSRPPVDPTLLDYPPTILKTLSYPRDLQNQPFDHDPSLGHKSTATTTSTNKSTSSTEPEQTPQILPTPLQTAPLPAQLSHVLLLPNALQASFCASLTTDAWEEAGQWFVERFGSCVGGFVEGRKRKRDVERGFEDVIARREELVRRDREGVERVLGGMKEGGRGVLRR